MANVDGRTVDRIVDLLQGLSEPDLMELSRTVSESRKLTPASPEGAPVGH